MFLVLVTIFLAFYFERAMAVAALVALVHDVVVTMGVYSIVGFEVTPATVIGLLTILGFSLYDTVVVFDKVKENTRGLLGLTRRTYAEAANLALNQTLMRSINTSLIAVLPVLGPDGRRRRAARRRHAGRPGAGADRRHPGRARCRRCCWRPRSWSTSSCVTRASASRPRRVAAAARPGGRGRAGRDRRSAGRDEPDLTDDDALAGELRRERAMAAAAGRPGPHRGRPAGPRTGRDRGQAPRPTGKRRR